MIGSNILVVCIGNICRSPMAEAFFANHFKKKSTNSRVASAGIHAMVGLGPAENAKKIMQEKYQIDIGQHRAKQITHSMACDHDLILVMDESQVSSLKKAYPFASGKIHRLGKWRCVNIADPYEKSEMIFANCSALIHDCVGDWVEKLW